LAELPAACGDQHYADRAEETLACFRQFVARFDGDFNAYRGMVSERYYQTACFQPRACCSRSRRKSTDERPVAVSPDTPRVRPAAYIDMCCTGIVRAGKTCGATSTRIPRANSTTAVP
jgi:hypothetical protein